MGLEDLRPELVKLVRGEFTCEAWYSWWMEHSREVELVLPRGEYLSLKLANSTAYTLIKRAFESQKVSQRILAKQGVIISIVDRYSGDLQKTIDQETAKRSVRARIIKLALTEFNANAGSDLVDLIVARSGETITADDSSIVKQLEQYFRFADKKPVWNSEPEWPTIEGLPATFIRQFECGFGQVAQDLYRANYTLYIFAYQKQLREDAYAVEHIVVTQR